jgi:hypothetical protein
MLVVRGYFRLKLLVLLRITVSHTELTFFLFEQVSVTGKFEMKLLLVVVNIAHSAINIHYRKLHYKS